MHVDLWSPGLHEDTDGNKGYLMKSMCDITQFLVSSPTTDIADAHLAQLFMADVVLSLGICSVVVIDDGSSFKKKSSKCAVPSILLIGAYPAAIIKEIVLKILIGF